MAGDDALGSIEQCPDSSPEGAVGVRRIGQLRPLGRRHRAHEAQLLRGGVVGELVPQRLRDEDRGRQRRKRRGVGEGVVEHRDHVVDDPGVQVEQGQLLAGEVTSRIARRGVGVGGAVDEGVFGHDGTEIGAELVEQRRDRVVGRREGGAGGDPRSQHVVEILDGAAGRADEIDVADVFERRGSGRERVGRDHLEGGQVRQHRKLQAPRQARVAVQARQVGDGQLVIDGAGGGQGYGVRIAPQQVEVSGADLQAGRDGDEVVGDQSGDGRRGCRQRGPGGCSAAEERRVQGCHRRFTVGEVVDVGLRVDHRPPTEQRHHRQTELGAKALDVGQLHEQPGSEVGSAVGDGCERGDGLVEVTNRPRQGSPEPYETMDSAPGRHQGTLLVRGGHGAVDDRDLELARRAGGGVLAGRRRDREGAGRAVRWVDESGAEQLEQLVVAQPGLVQEDRHAPQHDVPVARGRRRARIGRVRDGVVGRAETPARPCAR